MKKALSVVLVFVMIFGLCACGNKTSDYVGVWEDVDAKNDHYRYMYIYKDGTGDTYGTSVSWPDFSHFNPFDWKIEDGYFVQEHDSSFGGWTTKYTLDNGRLLDKQGKVAYIKVSHDTSVDL